MTLIGLPQLPPETIQRTILNNPTKSKKAYTFSEQLKTSETAERVFALLIRESIKNGRVSELIDVRESPDYQKKDIDFLCKQQSGKTVSYEIKNDTYTTGNIFAEYAVNTYSEDENGTVTHTYYRPGWLYCSNADYIFYYFEKTREAYLIKKKQFAAWIDLSFNRGSKEYEQKTFRPKSALNIEHNQKNRYYLGIGYLVPAHIILKANKMKNFAYKYIIDELDLENGKISFHREF